MTRTRSLLSLALVLSSLTGLTVSCGSDEVTKPDDDGGTEGGEGGKASAGTGGKAIAGSAGRGGSGGSGATAGGPSSTGNLGKACSEATNCGEDLACAIALDIPGGICTAECATDTDCQAFGARSACLAEICFEGCSASSLSEKCHGRRDMACTVYDTVSGDPCTGDLECGANEACLNGACTAGVTACLPSCASDADCGDAFCDISTGGCSPEKREGLPVGSPCSPDAAVDPCEGFCVGSGQDAFCSGFCRWSQGVPGCGYDDQSADVGAACLFVSVLLPNGDEGDTGFCGELCNCDSDCENPDFQCVEFNDGVAPFEAYGKKGYCRRPDPGEVTLPCGAGGAGGESGGGGTGAVSAGAGGDGGTTAEAGSSGAPTGDSGSGGTTGG